MITGTQLNTYCYQLEKIGYEIGSRAINAEQEKELKQAYERGLNKGIATYEESSKIVNDRDLDDFIIATFSQLLFNYELNDLFLITLHNLVVR